MNWTRLVAVTGVTVLVFLGGANAAGLQSPTAMEPACDLVAPPPALLDTSSKYEQTDATRSVLSLESAQSRETVLQPIRAAVRGLYAGVGQSGGYACTVETLAGWAAANALVDMRSEDAFLSRDRLISETVMLLLEAEQRGVLGPDRRGGIEAWLRTIAASTIDFYDLRAGQKSKRNNHRYWAGLAVGSIGYLLGDAEMIGWATRSYRLGVCQVDANGHLPLELARGSEALNYHVYALRPLFAFAVVAADHGDQVSELCDGGLKRLAVATRAALADPAGFGQLAGTRQAALPHETSYPEPLRLAAFGF
jgi:hypothetical protein